MRTALEKDLAIKSVYTVDREGQSNCQGHDLRCQVGVSWREFYPVFDTVGVGLD